MAYRNPAFLVTNRVAVAGAAAISVVSGAAFAADGPKERLIDGRMSRNAKAAATGRWEIGVDLGASFACNRLVIPIGHNLLGATVQVWTYTTPWTGGVNRASVTAGSGVLDVSFAEVSSRYWSLDIVQATTVWEVPEWVLGRYVQTSTGATPRWGITPRESVFTSEFATREATVQEAPARRELELEHRALAGADLAIYDDVLAAGRSRAFLHWPIDDAIAGPLLVKIVGSPDREQDARNPKGMGIAYRVAMTLLEQAT